MSPVDRRRALVHSPARTPLSTELPDLVPPPARSGLIAGIVVGGILLALNAARAEFAFVTYALPGLQ
jgi:hypothetical protein